MLLSTTVAVLLMTCSAEIILHDSDGSVLSDQPQHDPYMLSDADPYSNDGWMADWNPDWALLGGRINQPKCVDIPSNMSLCRHIGYTQMRLPNLLEHDTLQEVTSQAKSWNPLIGIRCHPDTKLFLCSLFSPVCLDRPIWPCRSLCDAVKNSCQGFMSKYGYPWPEMLRCDKFPLDNDLCIGLQNDNKPGKKLQKSPGLSRGGVGVVVGFYTTVEKKTLCLMDTWSIRSSDNDSTGFWPPGVLHTLGADGHI